MLSHIKAHVVGYLALFFVLAGSAYASHLTVFSSDIVDGQVRSIDVQNNGLTGTDIAESTLSVPAMGCQTGNIRGYARVKGHVANFPATWTSSPTYIDTRYNCSGNVVEAKKTATGVYYVRFRSNGSTLALTTPNADNAGLESNHSDNFVTVSRQFSGTNAGAFRVEVQNDSGSLGESDPQNGQFTIVLV